MQKIKDIKSKLGKWFWVIVIIIALIGWRIVVSLNKSLKVETFTVSRGDLILSISTSGEVNADQYSQLTFPSGGLVSWVGVKVGEKVIKGQAIAQLDAISLNAAYQQAQNNYRNYQATAENVLDTVKGHSADETFVDKAARTTAEVNRDNAYNAVLAAQDSLRNAKIYAPFAGIVDTVYPSSPGINVMPGAANYTIVNPDTVYFDAEVTELDLPNLSLGQSVKIKLDAYPDQNFNGIVESIGMIAFTSSTGGNAYHVKISFPGNEDQKIKVGMGGDAEIIYDTIYETLKVPAFAVVSEPTNYIWIIERGHAKKINVEIGLSSIDETEIKSGLSGGEIVISQPPANLKEGQRVQF